MATFEPIALTPRQAWQRLQEEPEAVLVDIRSTMEFLFVGHPSGARHVPWIDEPDWDVNPEFVDCLVRELRLEREAAQGLTLILICRSGNRSLEAGAQLLKEGFRAVYHVDDGFEGDLNADHHRNSVNGWRFDGLPWEQC